MINNSDPIRDSPVGHRRTPFHNGFVIIHSYDPLTTYQAVLPVTPTHAPPAPMETPPTPFSTESYFQTQKSPPNIQEKTAKVRQFVGKWRAVDGKKVVLVTVSMQSSIDPCAYRI